MNAVKPLPFAWHNIVLLTIVHAVAIGGTAIYVPLHGLPLSTVIVTAALIVLTIFSISAGYHRLFSHRAYEGHPVLRFLLLAFGAGAFQNSVIEWVADHRRHHARVDTELDPYDVRRGFWYAHIGWVLRKPDPSIRKTPVRDLERDAMVVAQDRYYVPISAAMGVGLPILLCWAFGGDPWGGFIIAGAVRLLVVFQVTFAINSFAHAFGAQPYTDENSSRDNLLTALVTMGEGYHNYHHAFPGDYRNGPEAHQFDPTKWVLWTLSNVGIARNLRRTPQSAIVRARVRMDERRLANIVEPAARARLQQLRAAVDTAATRWHELMARCEAMKDEATVQARALLKRLRAELRAAARELRVAYARWSQVVRAPGPSLALGA
jgi:stearoyl-CoA desaturase (delta-9 desaturase)